MILSRRQFLAALAVSSIGAPALVSQAKAKAMRSPGTPCSWVENLNPKTIAIVGDVQRTSSAELSFMGRPQHDGEREAILKAIAEDHPEMLLMLGDQVVTGDDDSQWRYFDECMSKVNEKKIPVYSLVGNHEYGESASQCHRNYNERFPHQRDQVHSRLKLGSIGLITVNSNFEQLRPGEVRQQEEDYNKWLEEFDADSSIRGVVVASHHPPYTNSDLGLNQEVYEMFALPYLKATKTKLYLSGHIHSYERFVVSGKMFVVSGGGGGPQRVVDNSASRPFHHDAYRKGTLRPFHYIMMTVKDDELKAEVKMLQKGKFKTGETFTVNL